MATKLWENLAWWDFRWEKETFSVYVFMTSWDNRPLLKNDFFLTRVGITVKRWKKKHSQKCFGGTEMFAKAKESVACWDFRWETETFSVCAFVTSWDNRLEQKKNGFNDNDLLLKISADRDDRYFGQHIEKKWACRDYRNEKNTFRGDELGQSSYEFVSGAKGSLLCKTCWQRNELI